MQKENFQIQSVQRSFAILEALHNYSDGASLTELMVELSLAKTTTYRALQNLIIMGYVTQDPISTKYRATLKTFEFSNRFINNFDILSYARPHLDKLALKSKETVHFVVRDGIDAVYLYKMESGGLQLSSRIGQRLPLYCSAVGKAILSTLKESEVDKIWQDSEIKQVTEKTITSLDVLHSELADIKQRGWALDDEENELGVRCVAVTIPTPFETAAFSVTGLSVRFDDERIKELADECIKTKEDILKDMGLKYS